MNRSCVPDVPLKVYFFIIYLHFIKVFFKFQVLIGSSLAKVAGRGRFSSLGLIMHRRSNLKLLRQSLRYIGQRLLSYNTYCGFLILRSDNFSWLLHLPGNCFLFKPMLSHSPGNFIFAHVINRILLLSLAGEFTNLLLLKNES